MQTTADVYSLEPSGVEMCVCKTQGGRGIKKVHSQPFTPGVKAFSPVEEISRWSSRFGSAFKGSH